ncbi:MAG TPA: PQQ-binding-like beta-propeller repeat protein [bacterium]|nr:PQQ-binding-like beta-propeller repeat protein [bacterium]
MKAAARGLLVAAALAATPACAPTHAAGGPAVAEAKPEPSAAATPVAPAPPFGTAWKFSMRHFELFPFASIEWASPVVADGTVFAASARGEAIYALDARSGAEKWSFRAHGRVEATPAVGAGRVYVATGKGTLFGLMADGGAELWHVDLAGISTSRLLFDVSEGSERVVVPTGDNKVHCIDARTGAELWVYRREPPSDLTVWGTGSPSKASVAGADAYVLGFSDGSVVAIKASNGVPLWEQRLVAAGRFRDIDGAVAVDGNRVYVTAYNDNLYALDRDSGRVVWSAPPGGGTGVAVGADKLFHGTDNGDLLARDPSDGHELWRWHLPAGVPTTPVVAGDFVYVASSSKSFYAVRADNGTLAWTFTPDYRVAGAWAAPAVDARHVYFVSNAGIVYAFGPQGAGTVYIGTWDSGVGRH